MAATLDSDATVTLQRTWQPGWILLSYILATVGSNAALHILTHARRYTAARELLGATAVATISLCATGIFAMHFVGMSAVDYSTPGGPTHVMRYHYWLTVLSDCLPCVFTWAAFMLLVFRNPQFGEHAADVEMPSVPRDSTPAKVREEVLKDEPSPYDLAHNRAEFARAPHVRLLIASFLVSGSVCTMHYIGMEAQILDVRTERRYNWGLIAVSGIICEVASWLALLFGFVLPITRHFKTLTAAVMGVAVCAMHYIGMYGIDFIVRVRDLGVPYDGADGWTERDLVIVVSQFAVLWNLCVFLVSGVIIERRESALQARAFEISFQRARVEWITLLYKPYLPDWLLDDESEDNDSDQDRPELLPAVVGEYPAPSVDFLQTPRPIPEASRSTCHSSAPEPMVRVRAALSGSFSFRSASGRQVSNNSTANTSGGNASTENGPDPPRRSPLCTIRHSADLSTDLSASVAALQHDLVHRSVTVMLIELSGFDADALEPVCTARTLFSLCSIVHGTVKACKGLVTEFGRARVTAEWGTQGKGVGGGQRRACEAALLAEELLRADSSCGPLKPRCSIASGRALVGVVGSENLHNHVILGNTPVLAEVLLPLCTHLGSQYPLCCHNTYNSAMYEYQFRTADRIRVGPPPAPAVQIYELLSRKENTGDNQEWMYLIAAAGCAATGGYEAGVEALFSGDYARAREVLIGLVGQEHVPRWLALLRAQAQAARQQSARRVTPTVHKDVTPSGYCRQTCIPFNVYDWDTVALPPTPTASNHSASGRHSPGESSREGDASAGQSQG
eukprot:TRINITY_DN35653_c0_g2_i2.p1 TRINITY_DN35653_c0_g2~~TRINITY_DN35653_c0_g2_i2.p1  ORF type:complete len:820 (+),score=217.03 TRINITY_DN35653_c0_g2_i2:85-2460(+)